MQRVERTLPGAHITHIEGRELPDEDVVVRDPAPPSQTPALLRLVYALVGLGLFVIALGLMKEGAKALIPSLEGSVFTDNAWSTLGLGWLGALIVLSGSPVAASALSLLDGGAITRTQSFTMLTGSRLGAAFVVLVVGFIYTLRNKTGPQRRAPMSIGILSLLMTMATYVPGAIVGYLLLKRGTFDSFDIGTSPGLTSATDTAFGWAVDLADKVLPGWGLFPLGVAVLLVGFSMIDRAMPQMGADRIEERAEEGWYARKWPMFLVGCGVTMLTLSVAVSLTLLVPLVAKGYLRRANVLPYIMGANITTLADTLVAAILLGNQDAVRVVIAVTVTVTVWTLFLLTFCYPLLRRALLGTARRILGSQKGLIAFVATLFLVPVILVAV